MCNFRSQEIGVLKPPKPLVQGVVITFVLFTASRVLELPKAFYGNSEAADRKAAADRIKRNPQNVRTILTFASPSMLPFSHGYLCPISHLLATSSMGTRRSVQYLRASGVISTSSTVSWGTC